MNGIGIDQGAVTAIVRAGAAREIDTHAYVPSGACGFVRWSAVCTTGGVSPRARTLAFVLVSAAIAVTACSGGITAPSEAAPAPATSAGTLTIRVLARTTELPINGAVVQYGAESWLTNASGELAITVPVGVEIAIDVTAAGYEPMGAAAVLGSNERWTFYLASSP